jgi:hypothetical protein
MKNLRWLMILVLLTGPFSVWAQTSQTLTQTVCIGSQPYLVDSHVGSTYAWSVSGGGIITSGQGTNSIVIDWTIPGGPYTVQVIETASACPAAPVSVAVTVVPQPVGPSLDAILPNLAAVCDGTNVSATFIAGSGGVGCSDAFQYRFDGVGGWLVYTPGDPLNTTGHTLVEIQGQRSGCTTGAGCTGTAWVTLASWVVNPNLPLSAAITASADPVCSGLSVTYTALPTNGGATPTYEWHVNGGASVGTTDNYTYTPAAGDVITCIVNSSEICVSNDPATATFNPVVNPVLPVSVVISASNDPVCTGTSVTYTANATNGGITPTYEWHVNAGPIAGTNSTYVYTPVTGDVITCIVNSSETCVSNNPATGTFNPVVNSALPVSVAIVASIDPVCAGSTVTYTATPTNGGTTPTYEWHVNGGPVVGTNSTYTYIPLAADVVTCIVTSNETCASNNPATGTFNPVVNPILPVSVVIAASVDPVCEGTSVTYIATPTNGGITPTYEWHVNGGPVLDITNTYSYVPAVGDVITCIVGSSETCVSNNPATGTFNQIVNPIPPTSPIFHN